ncbi:MAG: orotate phosphoribosyltransferase [Opitutales bacterium]
MRNKVEEEALRIFEETKALLKGHFILRSGRHSEYFFQCAQVCQYLDKVERLVELLRTKMEDIKPEVIVAPAMGALVLGQEMARQLGARYVFLDKENDRLRLRRGFSLSPSEKVLIVEDVVTRGGRVQEAIDIVSGKGCELQGVVVLVDRSEGQIDFEAPLISLIQMNFPTYDPERLPSGLAKIPPVKPGS